MRSVSNSPGSLQSRIVLLTIVALSFAALVITWQWRVELVKYQTAVSDLERLSGKIDDLYEERELKRQNIQCRQILPELRAMLVGVQNLDALRKAVGIEKIPTNPDRFRLD